jgi:hypothetical protein
MHGNEVSALKVLPSSHQTQPRSQPIPIKHTYTKNEIERNNPYDDADTQAQYEMATWNMYVLITTARRLRALNCGINETSCKESAVLKLNQPSATEIDWSRRRDCNNPFSSPVASPELHQPSVDDCCDGVFELDLEVFTEP